MEGKKNVKIVVLGDIGHSPRMANHAISLAKSGHMVDVVGFGESDLPHQFKLLSNIYHHFLIPCPKVNFRLLNYIFKTIWTAINLCFVLLITRRADVVMVQNPPAIPSLIVSWIYCRLIGAKFIIDWHNYAHTIMALNVGRNNFLVSITAFVEKLMGRRADFNFCVSKAMENDLRTQGIKSQVFYDRPSSDFTGVSLSEMHEFLKVLSEKNGFEVLRDMEDENSTLFTKFEPEGTLQLREDRPAFVVSSTSWTDDEDFSILLNALQDYENNWKDDNRKPLPNLLVAITGKGPLKNYYLKDIENRNWKHITIITPWLESKDYPLFIGCANFGVSLHTSSSGLDLPMKIVDLFGAKVPVLAYHFEALSELVVEGKNGYLFSNQQELSRLLQEQLLGFPFNKSINENLCQMKKELELFENWETMWNNICKPIFD